MSDKEVATRWSSLFKGTVLIQNYLVNKPLTETELVTIKATISVYRKRLFDISWFMRVLSEDIARRAIKEDDCKGRFWEGRFKSQALLDEAALAACMAYVDLNPVRAKIAKTPDKSAYTSIKRRIECAKKGLQPKALLPFESQDSLTKTTLPFELNSYLELVDLTSKCLCKGKGDYIDENKAILDRVDISPENWLILTTKFSRIFHGVVGKEKMMQRFYSHLKRQRRTNISNCQRYLG